MTFPSLLWWANICPFHCFPNEKIFVNALKKPTQILQLILRIFKHRIMFTSNFHVKRHPPKKLSFAAITAWQIWGILLLKCRKVLLCWLGSVPELVIRADQTIAENIARSFPLQVNLTQPERMVGVNLFSFCFQLSSCHCTSLQNVTLGFLRLSNQCPFNLVWHSQVQVYYTRMPLTII